MTLSSSRLDSVQPIAEADTEREHLPEQHFDFRGPWFTSAEGAAYVRSKSVHAFRMWVQRKHLVVRHRGTHLLVGKADIDRVLKAKRPKRVMAAASLANLRRK